MGLSNEIMRESILRHCKKYKASKALTEYWIANSFCEICGNYSAMPHHIRTRGAGGTDEPGNLLALCTTHHTEVGIGILTFGKRYEQFWEKILAALDIEGMEMEDFEPGTLNIFITRRQE